MAGTGVMAAAYTTEETVDTEEADTVEDGGGGQRRVKDRHGQRRREAGDRRERDVQGRVCLHPCRRTHTRHTHLGGGGVRIQADGIGGCL